MKNKDKIKERINNFINTEVDKMEKDGSIEHFEIEIKVYQKDVQVNTLTKKREKLY